MTAPTQKIEEGAVVHDGLVRRLYDPQDHEAARRALFGQGLGFSFGPLTIKGSVDLTVPSVGVEVDLLGVQLAHCDLSPANQNCTVGGSVAGFTAELDLTLHENPLQLEIQGKLCAPFLGCDSFDKVIPL